MNLFGAPTYNGYFKRGNTALPICGVCTNSAYKRPLKEVQVNDTMTAGTPLKVTNKAGLTTQTAGVNAGQTLAPNVFTAEKGTDRIDGFLIDSPTFVLEDDDEAPAARAGQIVYAALAGSGAELYLPCLDTLIGYDPTQALKLDTNGKLNLATGTAIQATILSQVVKGIRFKLDAGKVKAEEVLAVKVRL